jgi:hypothetical protein
MLQSVVVSLHERAFRKLLGRFPAPRRIAVVGGGLFPRTALVLGRVVPEASLTIIDANADHIVEAKRFLNGSAKYEHRTFESTESADGFDLMVIPLAFRGNRTMLYTAPPARAVLVHDWMWRKRGSCGVIVSPLLLKRLNLVLR